MIHEHAHVNHLVEFISCRWASSRIFFPVSLSYVVIQAAVLIC
jgi:hypothetical protein